tara:strand:- start:9943 stop:10137 length:195 start_codon:yes stop_codon:yes gene_type:complete
MSYSSILSSTNEILIIAKQQKEATHFPQSVEKATHSNSLVQKDETLLDLPVENTVPDLLTPPYI